MPASDGRLTGRSDDYFVREVLALEPRSAAEKWYQETLGR
jgi:hypothetical protein